MKRFSAIAFFFLALSASATNYYVKSNGGTGTGTSDATAWSFAYFMTKSQTFASGDSVLFRLGDTYLVTATVKLRTGVVYSTYGAGAKPVFSGFTTVSSWTSAGSGVYYTSLAYDVDFLLFNGIQKGKARFPQGTYNFLTYDAAATNSDGTGSITDNQLTGSWVNATAVVHTGGQEWQRKTIVSQAGTKLNFSSTESWNIGFGYFIQNSPALLTAAYNPYIGDWYYDATNQRLYMYFGANTPATYTVKLPFNTDIIASPSKTDLTVNGLCIEGTNGTGLAISNTTLRMTVQANEVRYCGTGIAASGSSSNCTVQNNYVHDCVNKGISGPITPTNYTIQGNRLIRIGMILGAGASGPSSYSAIYFEGGAGFTVRHNYIDTVGFLGIRCYRGANVLVEENIVKNFGYLKDDNGGTYAFSDPSDNSYTAFTNRIVRRNIFINGRSESGLAGTAGAARQSGFYLDKLSHHFLFDGNIIINMFGYGALVIGGTRDVTITNNLFFNVSRIGIQMNTASPSGDMNIYNNVMVLNAAVPAIAINNAAGTYSATGTLHNNVYRTPQASNVFQTAGATSGYKTLAQFQTAYGLESGSTWQATTGTEFPVWNESATDTTISFSGQQYRNLLTGALYNNSVTLAPYTSVMLVFNATLTDATAPIAGGSGIVNATALTYSGVNLSWVQATDETTVQSSLFYTVLANGSVIGSGTALSNFSVTGLTPVTGYLFTIKVRDAAGNETSYPSISVTTLSPPPPTPPAAAGRFILKLPNGKVIQFSNKILVGQRS